MSGTKYISVYRIVIKIECLRRSILAENNPCLTLQKYRRESEINRTKL